MKQVTWIYGNTASGKSTLAARLHQDEIILDGDDLRTVWTDVDLSESGRREHNLRTARLAKLLSSQGFGVIVATICPYRDLRRQVQEITCCRFIYVPGGRSGPEYPFEPPEAGE